MWDQWSRSTSSPRFHHHDSPSLLAWSAQDMMNRSISPTEATELLNEQEQLLNWSRCELQAATPKRAA